MDSYYVSKKAIVNGDNEVHKNSCAFMPEKPNRLYLGYLANCQKALAEASKIYPDTAILCPYCCPACKKV